MRLRHSVAVVLMAWYLMTPPPNFASGASGDPLATDLNAPFSKWYTAHTYDTAAACERELEQMHKNAAEAVRRGEASHDELWVNRCISSDDPRLKEK
jgi:hypothetical protein